MQPTILQNGQELVNFFFGNVDPDLIPSEVSGNREENWGPECNSDSVAYAQNTE